MSPTKDETARNLAEKHFTIEEGITRIFRLKGTAEVEAKPAEPIKLLEINTMTVPSGVMPIQFGAAVASGIFFPSIIVEVTPDEFDRIQTGHLALPEGWQIGEELPRPVNA